MMKITIGSTVIESPLGDLITLVEAITALDGQEKTLGARSPADWASDNDVRRRVLIEVSDGLRLQAQAERIDWREVAALVKLLETK